ncbi:single-stranded DNA-binding protein [Sulfurovum sp. ST-21]|uniref:Single-stranded DNA-binding protein n=1 Tax=Sulfurovum indicum TaxID=2779528 RepID=A0A7M1S298_9BACT|nr:single-stranded DNA-binding protein [Sulfurovum indicum]QOR61547.1 single-stranded DNA-binding protein [Sulfurovum indicum]
MYNKVILAGNLTRDVEVRYTPSGSAIGSTAIATSRKFKSATGEQKEEVLFIDLTFFGRTAEIANQYLRKGSKVLVDGRLKLDQWTAQDGSKRSKHSVTVENLQMLGSRDENSAMGGNTYGGQPQGEPNYGAPAQESYSQPAPSAPQSAPEPASNIPEIDISEDEIPF